MAKKQKQKVQKQRAGRGEGMIEQLTRYPMSTIALVGILICLPLIWNGLPETSDDTVWHVIYFDNFATQFFSGEIYPRWLYLTNGGLGGPTFFFYQPMSYYIAAIFRPLPISTAHQLGLASSLGVVLSEAIRTRQYSTALCRYGWRPADDGVDATLVAEWLDERT